MTTHVPHEGALEHTTATEPQGAQRPLTCPECGQPAVVSMNRRLADDFCPRCDYPLFWTPTAVVTDTRGTGESLKRLPGAVGRQAVGSVGCPHCAERNAIQAVVCVRCGGAMRVAPVAPPPLPEPVPVPLAAPVEPEPEPDHFWWWVSVSVGVGVVVLIALLLLQWLM